VLEIGCGNGIRLEQMREAFDCACFGIDPSAEAVRDGTNRFPALSLSTGTADRLNFENGSFDAIHFGFCLYFCDRQDLFKIAFEADRCLKDPGTMIITDFAPAFAYRNSYAYRDDVYSFKMDYAKMFSWNPGYSEVARIVYAHSDSAELEAPDDRVAAVALRKNGAAAYPTDPYRANG
jgi:ubiquinone/menaquinone biosynthesis C-methylase UbiE